MFVNFGIVRRPQVPYIIILSMIIYFKAKWYIKHILELFNYQVFIESLP